MPKFNVKVRDKRTNRESVELVSGPADAAAAKAHVEGLPGSRGGTHPGFDVLDVEELDDDGKPLPKEESATVAAEDAPAIATPQSAAVTPSRKDDAPPVAEQAVAK